MIDNDHCNAWPHSDDTVPCRNIQVTKEKGHKKVNLMPVIDILKN